MKISTRKFTISILLLFILIMLLIYPQRYMASCLNGLKIWFMCVLPALFPFIAVTKLINSVGYFNTVFAKCDGISQKLFKLPSISIYIFFISIISGYPVGAKLICDCKEKNLVTRGQAHRLTALCTTSGPMFIIGTVGAGLIKNSLAGIIILISHIVSAILNGLIFSHSNLDEQTDQKQYPPKINSLSEDISSAVGAILMIGGFISISYILIDMVSDLHLLSGLSYLLQNILSLIKIDSALSTGMLNGLIEATNGIMSISITSASIAQKTCCAGFIITFSGLSILLQCYSFLQKAGVGIKFFIKTKLCHTALCMCILIPLSIICL